MSPVDSWVVEHIRLSIGSHGGSEIGWVRSIIAVNETVGTLIESQGSNVGGISGRLKGATRSNPLAIPSRGSLCVLRLGAPGELHKVGDVDIGLSDNLNVTVELINVSVAGVVDEESHGDISVVNKNGLKGVDTEVTVTVAFTHGCDGKERSCECSEHVTYIFIYLLSRPIQINEIARYSQIWTFIPSV